MTDLIAELAKCIRDEADYSSRAGQYRRLHDIADKLDAHAAEIEAMARDKRRMDWIESQAHCLDWDDDNPLKRVIKADDGEESCADTWREAIDLAMRSAKEDGNGHA